MTQAHADMSGSKQQRVLHFWPLNTYLLDNLIANFNWVVDLPAIPENLLSGLLESEPCGKVSM
jgi:hypothetical protein